MGGLAIGWRIMWTGRFLGSVTGEPRSLYGVVNLVAIPNVLAV
ncbi:hypothetical protein ES703_55209 [subsurface metagenome]